MEDTKSGKQERVGLIGAKEGDVLRRKPLIKPQDEIANTNLGGYSYFDCITMNNPELKLIKLKKDKAEWGASINTPESDFNGAFYEVITTEKIPTPIASLIKEYEESKKKQG